MPTVVQFIGPRQVAVAEEPRAALRAGHVRVATLYSGISAGTELTAYRGSNPYLTKTWDRERRLYVDGLPSFAYPVSGWGYQEVGRIVEVAPDVAAPSVGELVYGIWGHRSESVLPAAAVADHVLRADMPPECGVFARVGAIALNAVLAANIHIGEHVAVFGQGVIGLLATRLAVLSGGTVAAVDMLPERLERAIAYGAATSWQAAPALDLALTLKQATGGPGADVAIELSGSYSALHEAVRCVRPGGYVVAAGFYQGEGVGLRLGEEFHHNRVELVPSQIGGVPQALAHRWDHERLLAVFMALVAAGEIDVLPLISHVRDVADAAAAYALLDQHPQEALQVILRFPAAEEGRP